MRFDVYLVEKAFTKVEIKRRRQLKTDVFPSMGQ